MMASGASSDVATVGMRTRAKIGVDTATTRRGEPLDIVVSHLVKDFGAVRAVDDLSFSVPV
jgi:hypothetical protein